MITAGPSRGGRGEGVVRPSLNSSSVESAIVNISNQKAINIYQHYGGKILEGFGPPNIAGLWRKRLARGALENHALVYFTILTYVTKAVK